MIDLATLRGEVDHACLLDGEPVPARVGRALARDVAVWRRMVTAPVTGHLLDYGRATYLPARLRAFIGERDAVCTTPWCEQPAHRAQMDHAVPFPHGPSDTTNTGLLCQACHQLKTAGLLRLTRTGSDGSATLRTAWGQHTHVGPRPYLDTGTDQPSERRRQPPALRELPPF